MLIKFLPSFTEITIDDIRLRVIVEVETNSAPLRFEKTFLSHNSWVYKIGIKSKKYFDYRKINDF